MQYAHNIYTTYTQHTYNIYTVSHSSVTVEPPTRPFLHKRQAAPLIPGHITLVSCSQNSICNVNGQHDNKYDESHNTLTCSYQRLQAAELILRYTVVLDPYIQLFSSR